MSTNLSNFKKNNYYMTLALKQAERLLGNTAENPSVGCVLVKNNSVISSGFTGKNGRPHAEQNAINMHKGNIKDSCLYVTLEPCSHHGKTPPCVTNIVKNKIKKVYFSIFDPDIRSHKKSLSEFKKKKILVEHGILRHRVKFYYRSYIKFKKSNLPFVTAKIATSKDFYTINKKSRWITNKFSRARTHLLRSRNDCIITSAATVISDNPSLTCRVNGLTDRSPIRIVLDKNLEIPLNSNIVKSSKFFSTIIFFNKYNSRKIKFLKRKKIKLIRFKLSKNNNFNLTKILIKIKQLGFSRVFLESGVNLIENFLNDNLIDDFYHFISNKNLEKKGSNNIKSIMKVFLRKKSKIKVNLFGDNLYIYRLK